MVKTVRGLLSLKEIKQLLTEYARTVPAYLRVDTPEVDIIFYNNYVRLYLKQPDECPACNGTGKYLDKECDRCEGTGKIYWRNLPVKISEYKEYPHYGTLKIEVDTQGSDPDVWKPDVERVRQFIEKLAGKRCIITPEGQRSTFKKVTPIAHLTKSLQDYLKGNG